MKKRDDTLDSMVTTEELEHIAHLARLEYTPEALEALRGDFENIFGYINQLNEVEGSAERQTAASSMVKNVMREDKITTETGEYTEALLDAAPKRNGDFIEVKKIIGGSQ